MTHPQTSVPWSGGVEPGYEPVLDAFIEGLPDLGAGGGAFAAYHRGEKVVDLWGGWAGAGHPWAEDTLAVLFSGSKGVATLCLQILCDSGSLAIDTRVSDLWPEFAAEGKHAVRIRHVLNHTSGVLAPTKPDAILSWDGRGWADCEAIEAGLAATSPAVPIGATFAYHALSFGWLANAVLRRVTNQSIGQFLQEEVSRPLGLDIHIGTPPRDHPRVAQVMVEPPTQLPREAAATAARVRALARDPATLLGRAFLAMPGGDLLDNLEAFNQPALLEAEVAAINATATARSLARLYAVLSAGGETGGTRLVSRASVDRFRLLEMLAPNALELEWDPPTKTIELHRRMLGYHGSSKPFGLPRRLGPSETAFGHDGVGGQVAFADPERSIAAAFVRNRLTSTPWFSARLLELLYDCASRGQ